MQYTTDVLFRDLCAVRPLRRVTVTALIANGQVAQMAFPLIARWATA